MGSVLSRVLCAQNVKGGERQNGGGVAVAIYFIYYIFLSHRGDADVHVHSGRC